MLIKLVEIFAASLLLLINAVVVYADHEGPERIVEGKYTVILTIIPIGDDSLNLRFFFRDTQTGRAVSDIVSTVFINDESGAVIASGKSMDVRDGAGELQYIFPKSGFFEIFLEFRKIGEPNKIYKPSQWHVWVPGKEGASRGASYPLGLSELAGFGLLGFAIVIVAWSYISNRKAR